MCLDVTITLPDDVVGCWDKLFVVRNQDDHLNMVAPCDYEVISLTQIVFNQERKIIYFISSGIKVEDRVSIIDLHGKLIHLFGSNQT